MFASMAGSGMEASGWGVFSTDVGSVVTAAVVGGTASGLGGGKFANGAVTGAYTMLFNHMAHQKQEQARERFRGRLISDRNKAIEFMHELSLENEVEVSGWVVEKGVIVMPFEGENYQGVSQRNTDRISHNNWFRGFTRRGIKYVEFNGEHRILGQIHTHPINTPSSDADMNLAIQLSLPVVSVSPNYISYTRGFLISFLPRDFNINELFNNE